MKISINVEFSIGDMVYVRTDTENEPSIVVGYEILPGEVVKYRVNNEQFTTSFYDFELSTDKNVF